MIRPLSALCQSWLFLFWFTKALATLYESMVMQIKLVANVAAAVVVVVVVVVDVLMSMYHK